MELDVSKIKLLLSVFLLGLMACNAETASHKKESQHIQLKPHAPVYMSFTMPEKIAVNKEATVLVTLKNEIDVDDLIVSFHTKNNLKLVSEKQYSLGIQPASQSNTLEVIVVPQNEGLAYINISVTLVSNGVHQSRSFAIPVTTGDKTINLKAFGVKTKSSKGRGIISMPAVEPAK
jgi:hypothetical protein